MNSGVLNRDRSPFDRIQVFDIFLLSIKDLWVAFQMGYKLTWVNVKFGYEGENYTSQMVLFDVWNTVFWPVNFMGLKITITGWSLNIHRLRTLGRILLYNFYADTVNLLVKLVTLYKSPILVIKSNFMLRGRT